MRGRNRVSGRRWRFFCSCFHFLKNNESPILLLPGQRSKAFEEGSICLLNTGSSLYVDLRPGWSTTAEHKRRSIAGSAASTKGPDPPRRCGATSCRRVHRQSRSGSALESASTCRERARMRRDGSWRWYNLGKTMRRGLLGSGGTSVGRRSDASRRTASSGPAGIAFRVLATEREPLRAQAKTGHTVRHNLLQGVEETHFYRYLRAMFVS